MKRKRQNQFGDGHIENIVTTYQHRNEQDRYSRRVSYRDRREGLQLKCLAVRQEDGEIDLAATHAELVRIEGDITKATAKHNAFLKELGLPLLPSPPSTERKRCTGPVGGGRATGIQPSPRTA